MFKIYFFVLFLFLSSFTWLNVVFCLVFSFSLCPKLFLGSAITWVHKESAFPDSIPTKRWLKSTTLKSSSSSFSSTSSLIHFPSVFPRPGNLKSAMKDGEDDSSFVGWDFELNRFVFVCSLEANGDENRFSASGSIRVVIVIVASAKINWIRTSPFFESNRRVRWRMINFK